MAGADKAAEPLWSLLAQLGPRFRFVLLPGALGGRVGLLSLILDRVTECQRHIGLELLVILVSG